MNQEVKYIDISKLVLWTENPRDPIDPNATDQDVVDNAIKDKHSKWSLSKLAKDMGPYYDLSELPTVVYHKKKPVVYDGNRRMILAKIKYGLVEVEKDDKIQIPEIPKEIPCNVCSKAIALQNVFRKHGDSGSWTPLDRDIFIHKYLGETKSIFLKLDESTGGLIRQNPHLNKGFVKKEIFSSDKLKELGFDFEGDHLISKHTIKDSKSIFSDLSDKIAAEVITTRKKRGEVFNVLEKKNRDIVEKNRNKPATKKNLNFSKPKSTVATPSTRVTKRTKNKANQIFGGKLILKPGEVSDLYRDIVDLYGFYVDNKKKLSKSFTSLIRMSLRLLCESAANGSNSSTTQSYLKNNFKKGKANLNKDQKTTLSTLNVTENSIMQLLHVGAHQYSAAKNIEQTLALSLIIGEMLKITHGK